MKVRFRQAAVDDVSRQFRYYLFTENLPEVAVRFRTAVQGTVEFLRQRPFVGPRYHSRKPKLEALRSWPVAGFEAIRIYYLLDKNAMQVIRVLHGKRDLKAYSRTRRNLTERYTPYNQPICSPAAPV